ncbi:MAG: transglutaminase domain-containing protein [Bullifex sp.]
MKTRTIIEAVIAIILLTVAAVTVIMAPRQISYLQDPEQIYTMEAGILKQNLYFRDGEAITISYSFDEPGFNTLKKKYGLEMTAGKGSSFHKAVRLMNEYAPRLTHESNYDNHVEIRALPLLEYSLDKKQNGINCLNKAQILNEMCLALGIHSRKLWLMPVSPYDNDCHVVNEIWDEELNKWIMLDITDNSYWVDENGTPLSALEIRTKGAKEEFCTPVHPDDGLSDLGKVKKKNLDTFLYIMKNMAWLEYKDSYGEGSIGQIYTLCPEAMDMECMTISIDSIIRAH